MVTIVLHVAKLRDDLQTDASSVEFGVRTDLDGRHRGDGFVGHHFGQAPLIEVLEVDATVLRIGGIG